MFLDVMARGVCAAHAHRAERQPSASAPSQSLVAAASVHAAAAWRRAANMPPIFGGKSGRQLLYILDSI